MACRSGTGFGRSSDGGSGIPGVPQPIKASKQKEMAEMVLVRRRKKSVSEESEQQT